MGSHTSGLKSTLGSSFPASFKIISTVVHSFASSAQSLAFRCKRSLVRDGELSTVHDHSLPLRIGSKRLICCRSGQLFLRRRQVLVKSCSKGDVSSTVTRSCWMCFIHQGLERSSMSSRKREMDSSNPSRRSADENGW